MSDNQFGSDPTMAGMEPMEAASTPTPVSEPALDSVSEPASTSAPVQGAITGEDQPKKKSSVALIAILAIFAVVAIVITGVVAYNMGKNDGMASRKTNNGSGYVDDEKKDDDDSKKDDSDSKKDDDSSKKDDDSGKDDDKKDDSGKDESTAMEQRNTQREDDLARVVNAINNFQANNNGKVPFNANTTDASLATFVSRYIDSTCTLAGTAIKCGENSNKFRDPQGDTYKIVNKGKAVDGANVSAGMAEKTFYGYYNASCGDGGTVKSGTGDRDVAVFMKLEGGAIVCNANH